MSYLYGQELNMYVLLGSWVTLSDPFPTLVAMATSLEN